MFNRTYVSHAATEYVPYAKTIIEHRAPTDDSIRIYGEIKHKAYDSILMTIEGCDNELGIKAMVYREYEHMCTMCKYVLKLNGREIKDEIKIHDFNLTSPDRFEVMGRIYEAAAKHIAIDLISHITKQKSVGI